MTSQAKFKIILVVLVALMVIGGAGLFVAYRFWPSDNSTSQTNQVTNTNTTANTNVPVNTNEVVVNLSNSNQDNQNSNVNTPSGEPLPDENRVLALARSFTERYGSFSNQNEFENLERLFIYMTPKLQQATQEFIDQQSSQQATNDPYYGVTTDVVTITFDKFEEDKAVTFVATRRRESREGEAAVVYSQTARVVMVKQDGEWLVDKFEWQ